MATAPIFIQTREGPRHNAPALLAHLVQHGILTYADSIAAQALATKRGLHIVDILVSTYEIAPLEIANAYGVLSQSPVIHPNETIPDVRLIDQLSAAKSLQLGLLPWRNIAGQTIILTDRPDQFDRHADMLSALFGQIHMGVTTSAQIEQAVLAARKDALGLAAETKVPADLSCRTWQARKVLGYGICGVVALICATVLAPTAVVSVLCGLAVLILVLCTMLKAIAAFTARHSVKDQADVAAVPARLPKITLLVPLFRETEIAGHLLARLNELDYPRELMDVCLVTESDDDTTRTVLQRTKMPHWMRAIVVPQGTLRTKPRALNFALNFARGSIVGVYDAEDAPAPDQLHKVATHFANCASDVACLQGVLDYYNDSSNWLTRCFTIEYASWFRIVLPGLERLGLVVPLGGTTLFFKRDILEKLGGWDAHNVTEDADLGVRLARAGYRTELIATITAEEANGRIWPWVKQRSRWLKGYAITYAVHMRAPRQLWSDLGARRFWGVQLLFGGTLAQFILAPVLWSFWMLPFGLYHPLQSILAPGMFWALAAIFFLSEIITLWVAALALIAARKTWLIKWALTLQFYFPLAAVAAYKGILELAWRPYYWDKTSHGVLLPSRVTARPQPPAHQSLDGSQMP